jgi:hypothetical protein
MYNRVAFP